MTFNKKNTYEQHDNEKGSFYKSSVLPFNKGKILNDNINIDLCIIGGGITGISSALYLAKKGYSVTLLEARTIGWGASGRNGGHLGVGMRRDQQYLEKKFGNPLAKEFWSLGLEAVSETKNNILEYNIDCSLQKGIIAAGYHKSNEDDFLKEIEHMNKYYDFNGYEFLNKNTINDEINTDLYCCGLLNNYSYHINPLKYLLGLTNEVSNLGVDIYEHTPVNKIKEENDSIKIFSGKKIIKCNRVIVACNGYLDKLLGNIRNKFMPINNYIIATEPLGKELASKIIKNNYAVHDTRFIIDYYRFSEDWRMLFGGGETYTAKFLTNPTNFVSQRMKKVFPILKNYKIEYSWGGTLAITVKRLPDFGTLMNDKIIYAHGYSGHGLALSTLAGKLISEKVSGNTSRFEFFSNINNFYIPGGDFLRRPIYTSAVAYYKFIDFIKN